MIKYTLLKIKIFFIVFRKLGIITAGVKTLILPLKILDHELPHDGKILDIGCGEGLYGLAARLLRRNIDLTILDNDQVKIEKAERICKPNKIINTKFEHYENDSSYDFIIVNDFMHHIDYESHHVFIAKIKSLLVKNGKFFFKDVDQSDGFDNKITKFFDLKIEPNLKICFREKNEWVKLIERNGLSYSNAYKYFNVHILNAPCEQPNSSAHVPMQCVNTANIRDVIFPCMLPCRGPGRVRLVERHCKFLQTNSRLCLCRRCALSHGGMGERCGGRSLHHHPPPQVPPKSSSRIWLARSTSLS